MIFRKMLFEFGIADVQVKAINPRKLPSEETLVEMFEQVRDTPYRWVVGMMIAYGLRNRVYQKICGAG